MAVNFPSSPSDGDIHTELGRGWQYNATAGAWKSIIRVDTVVDTEDIIELAGATNKWYRDERVQDDIASFLQAGTGIGLVYDDAAGTLTISTSGAVNLSANTTDQLPEGSTNLYYTDARVQSYLGGNLAGHIIPNVDSDGTTGYDLGSSSFKFRDLYMSGSTINLGNQTISADSAGIAVTRVATETIKLGNSIINKTADGKIILPRGSTFLGTTATNDQSELPEVDLTIAPETLTIQVDAPGAGQDTPWVWTWLQSTLPYARRTITNSNEPKVPLYLQGTYTLNNFAKTTHGNMTQTHSIFLKWVEGAGSDNLVSWATDQGTVQMSHPDINSGNTQDVQRLSISVPTSITLPTLTAPTGVEYNVAFGGAGIYAFTGDAAGDNPNLGPLYRGGTYTFNVNAIGHPFYLTTDNGSNFSNGTYFGEYTSGVTNSRADNGTITFTVPANAPDTLYYQCAYHAPMFGAITIKDLAVETNVDGNYIIYAQHSQEGHKTPIELRPIPSLVNQMCLVYDNTTSKFVPQDLATYVENTPSFENKIRDVAGTASLVDSSGTVVVSKVNIYYDNTYLPITGQENGAMAFTSNNQTFYIWDGYSWKSTKVENTDGLTEGSTNLYYTTARVNNVFASKYTDDLAEGSTNKYFTDTRVQTYLSGGTATTIQTTGDITVGGNLVVQGTTTTVNSNTVNIGDSILTLNSDETGAPTQNGGIEIERGTSTNKSLVWDETADKWTVGSETFIAGTFEGALTGNVTGNITGQVSDISNHTTDALSEGSTNQYFTNARADARIAAATTTDLSEGTNLYYTDARAQAVSINEVVEDTTPQLGGDLDTNSKNITFGDSSGATVNRLQFGKVGGDLQIYHNGNNSIIEDSGAGVLNLITNGTKITMQTGGGGTMFNAIKQGAVELWYNNIKRFETTATGATVTGSLTGNVIGQVSDISNFSTTDLAEGTNLYYTDERVDDRIDSLFNAGVALTGTYNDAGNSFTIDLDDTAVTPGSYGSSTAIPVITVDQQGRITAASTASINTSFTVTDGTTNQTISGGDTITFADGTGIDVVVSATDTVTISHNVVGANGTFGSATAIPVLQVDAQGHVTSVSTVTNSFTVSDGSNTQTIEPGNTLRFNGTGSEVEVTVGATDQVTIGLPSDVTISNDLTVSGDLIVTGNTTQTGTIVSNSNFTGLSNANTGNATDFGFYGKYVESATTKYAGIFYDASETNSFRLFADTQTQPSTTVDTTATGYAHANLYANDIILDGAVKGPATFTIDPSNHGDNTGTVVIAGNLTVNGTTTTVNSNTVNVGDNILVLNSDETGTPSQDAGIAVERGTSTNVSLIWNETDDQWQVTEDGSTYYDIFHDGYHPNADAWTTARTITLGGDLSGNVSIDGSGDVTLTATVADDSHNHDGRYYTETESDARFLQLSGGTLAGDLTLSGSIVRSTQGAFLKVDLPSWTTANEHDVIYTGYQSNITAYAYMKAPMNTTSGHGIIAVSDTGTYFGTTDQETGALGSTLNQPFTNTWGYVNATAFYHGSDRVFDDGYHPNADAWTTARTITLAGDLTGNVSIDGSADVTLTGTVTATARATVQDAAPSSPSTGDFWYESDSGILYVYYDSFWVDTAPALGTDSMPRFANLGLGADATSAAPLWIHKDGTAWNTSTQGPTNRGSIHLDPSYGTIHANNTGNAITWGARDAGVSTNGDTAQAGIYVTSDGSFGTRMYFSTTDSYATGPKTAFDIDQAGIFHIRRNALRVANDVTAYYSDVRLKQVVGSIDNAIEAVKAIDTFKYKHNEIAKQHNFTDDKVHVGVSAQSVEAVLPEVVEHAPFDMEEKDNKVTSKTGEWYKTVKYDKMVPLLIEAIKEQQTMIDEMKQEINKLKGEA